MKFLRMLGIEDVALLLGVGLIGIGTGMRFGVASGLIAVGVCFVAYGVWITERR